MTKPSKQITRDEKCPNCGKADQWYPTGRVNPDDLRTARAGGPKAPIEMSLKGGHCLICDHKEEDVWA
jgi:hypothetical protein